MIEFLQLAQAGGTSLITAVVTVYFMTKRNSERTDDAHRKIDIIEADRKICGAAHDGKIAAVYGRMNDLDLRIMSTLTEIKCSVARLEERTGHPDYAKTQKIKDL